MTAAPLRVGVVGLGLIGGSLALGLAEAGGGFAVRGWDAAEAVRELAGARVELADGLEPLAGWADLVVVATPPRFVGELVVACLRADPEVVVADVASVKAPLVDAVRAGAVRDAVRYLPTHPLAGAETAGWEHARGALLREAVWAVCPHDLDAPWSVLEPFARVADALAARLVFCTAAEHDEAVARSSHVPHLVAVALAQLAASPLSTILSGGALRDGTRVAGADPELWTDVMEMNRDPSLQALSALHVALDDLHAALTARDEEALHSAWAVAGRARRALERTRWNAPAWESAAILWPAWAALVGLGREARVVRHLRYEDEELGFERG